MAQGPAAVLPVAGKADHGHEAPPLLLHRAWQLIGMRAAGGPDAVQPVNEAAQVSGAPDDPAVDPLDAADRARHAGTQTSEVLPQHLAAAVTEEPPPPPGHKKHVGPGSGHKHKHKNYEDAEHRKRERERHSAAPGGADPNPDVNPGSDGRHGAKDAVLAAARAVQAGAVTQTDAAFAAEGVDAAAGAPHVAYGPQHIMTSLAGVDAAAAAAAAAAAPAQAAAAPSQALASEPAPAPSLAPAPVSGGSGSVSGLGAGAPIPAGLAAAMAEEAGLMREQAAGAAAVASRAAARAEAGKQAVKESSYGWWRG